MNADEAKLEIERLDQEVATLMKRMWDISNECSHIDSLGNSTLSAGNIYCLVCNKDIETINNFIDNHKNYIDSNIIMVNRVYEDNIQIKTIEDMAGSLLNVINDEDKK